MKNYGRNFEKRILQDCKAQSNVIRKIPEQVVGYYGRKQAQKKTCYDFIAGVNGRFISFDAKSTSGRSLNIKSKLYSERSAHQFKELCDDRHKGVIAGYLVEFRLEHIITWFPIRVIEEIIFKKPEIKSITPRMPGTISQLSSKMLDLKMLCFHELKQIDDESITKSVVQLME